MNIESDLHRYSQSEKQMSRGLISEMIWLKTGQLCVLYPSGMGSKSVTYHFSAAALGYAFVSTVLPTMIWF